MVQVLTLGSARCCSVRTLAIALVAAFGAVGPAWANTFPAVEAAGGLVPIKTEDIAIEDEDLYISPYQVRVRYRFRNLTDQDIETPVVFPLPDIDLFKHYTDDRIIHGLRVNTAPKIDFSVRADGRDVTPAPDWRAITHDGRDVTDRLIRLGPGPLNAKPKPIESFDQADLRDLYAEGIVDQEKFGVVLGRDIRIVHTPNWLLRGSYSWRQRFPAGAITEVEINYKPFVGGKDVGLTRTDLSSPAKTDRALAIQNFLVEPHPWPERYCVTRSHLAELKKFPKFNDPTDNPNDPDVAVPRVYWLRYILVTARQWQEPIRQFRLTVDKLFPEAITAFCSPDGKTPIVKSSPTAYAVTIKNFQPRNNLAVVFLAPE